MVHEKISHMKNETLLSALEETAEKLAITLDYDDLRKGVVASYGDSFTLRGKKHIVIDKRLTAGEKADLLLEILARFDTESIHLPPDIRSRLDEERERSSKETQTGQIAQIFSTGTSAAVSDEESALD
jgi:hypothetical protein